MEEEKSPLCKSGDLLWDMLLFLGILGDILGVVPDHDEHHGGFVENADNNRHSYEEDEEHEEADAAKCEEAEGVEHDEDSRRIVNYLQDALDPHDFEGEEIFEPFGEFVLGVCLGVGKEEEYQDATNDGKD